MQKGFIFDINKCVACQACVMACQIENMDLDVLLNDEKWEQQIPWRKVTSHNEAQHPDLPVFNFSMACNHCEYAPCMDNCPALAYTRDKDFNAIIHLADSCIGCRYCTMVCPYDAPKYNPFTGIVEKCTLCVQRLSDNKKPACASSCPTGALDYDRIKIEPQYIEGFTEISIKPAIDIKALRNPELPRKEEVDLDIEREGVIKKLNLNTNQKHKVIQEWPLISFSLLIPILVSAFYASFSKGILLNPFVFAGSLILVGVLSMAHLGRKMRTWRSLLNIRNSWLSREILAYSLFVPASTLWLFFPNQNELGLAATIFGLFILISIDNIYRQIPSKKDNKYHSADVLFFTVFLYVAILVANPWMFFAALALKAYLYITRKIVFKKQEKDILPIISTSRLILGLVLPILLFFIIGFEVSKYLILGSVILGEVIDRVEFYLEL